MESINQPTEEPSSSTFFDLEFNAIKQEDFPISIEEQRKFSILIFHLLITVVFIILGIINIHIQQQIGGGIFLFTILVFQKIYIWKYPYFLVDYEMMFFLVETLIVLALLSTFLIYFRARPDKDKVFYDLTFQQKGKITPFAHSFACIPLLIPIIIHIMEEMDEGINLKGIYRTSVCFSFFSLVMYLVAYCGMGKCEGSINSFLYKKCFVSSCIAFHFMYLAYSICVCAKSELSNIDGFDDLFRIITIILIGVYGFFICLGTILFKNPVFGLFGLFVLAGILNYSSYLRKFDMEWFHSYIIPSSVSLFIVFLSICFTGLKYGKEVLN